MRYSTFLLTLSIILCGLSTFAAAPSNPTGFAALPGSTKVNLGWTNPGAFDEIMIVAGTATIATVPTGDGSAYTANAAFGSGTAFGATGFVVYKGTGSAALITALTNGTNYFFKIFARGGTGGAEWSGGVEISSTPCAPTNATGTSATPGNTTATVNWTNSACKDAVIVVAGTATITAAPSGDGSTYTASTTFGSGFEIVTGPNEYIVYNGTGTSVAVDGLANGTQYFFRIFTRKNTDWSAGIEVSTTPVPAPATGGSFSNNCTDGMTVTWTNPSPVNTILVFAKLNSAVTIGPLTKNAAFYTPSTTFGSGTAFEGDAAAFCIFNSSSGNSVDLSNLQANKTYHFLIYNLAGTTYSSGLTANNTTLTTPPNASSLGLTPGDGSIDLSWTNPGCMDEILVVARQSSAVSATVSGDGTNYTANSVFGTTGTDANLATNQFAVYKGTGNSVTVTGLINGQTYHFKIFTRKGTIWSSGVTGNATAVDMTPPVISNLNPTDNNLSVSPLLTQVVLTFNENIAISATSGSAASKSFELYEGANPTAVLTYDRGAPQVSVSTNQATINISAYPLKINTDYHILVGSKVFRDGAGNDFAGISSATTWNWHTSGAVVTPPSALNVCANSAPRTLGDIVIEESGNADFNTNGTFSLQFNPNSGFAFMSGTGSVTFEAVGVGNDITSITGISTTFNTITFTITLDGVNDKLDRIRISGLKISSDGTSPSTTLKRSGGTALILGDEISDNIVHATINSGIGPAAPGSITTNPVSFMACQGASLAGASVTVGTGTSNLKWYSDAALTVLIGGATNGNANPTATQLGLSSATPGTFTRYVTQTTTCESAGTPVTFTVNPKPVADAGAPKTICSGAQVTLGGSPLLTTTTTGPYTFAWSGPGSPSAVANPTLTPPDPGASNQVYDYNLVVTDGNSCQSTTSIQQVTVKTIAESVTITKPTQSDFVATENQVPLEGQPITNGVFSGPGVIQLGDGTYQFNPSAAGTAGSPHTIYYTATLANGCSKTVSRQFNVSNTYNVINNLTDKYCSSEGQTAPLAVTPAFQTEIENFITTWNTQYVLLYGWGPLVPFNPSDQNFKNYYGSGVTGSGTNYRFNPGAITKPCPTCDYAYVGVFLKFATVNYSPYGTPDFLYGGEFVTVNPTPAVSFTGLNSGLPIPTNFCNVNQDYQLTANVSGGKFFLDGVEATISTTGLTDIDGTGPLAIFNPLSAGLGPHTIRFEYDPGTTGSTGQACKGSFQIGINVNALPAISFNGPTPASSSVFCYAETPVTLSATQTTNVIFSGLGVTNSPGGTGTFNPNQAFLQREAELGSTQTTPQSFNVVVTYKDAIGCANTDTRTYEVRPLPPAVFTYGPKKDFCYEDADVPFTSSNTSGRYQIYYVRQPALPDVLIVTEPTKDYSFDPSDIFDLAVVNGASPLSTPTFRVVFTTNDPVKTSCTNTQVEQFTVAPVIPASIAGVNDLEIYCANEGTRVLTMNPPNGTFKINGSVQTLIGGDTYNFNQEPNGGDFQLNYVVTTGTGCTTTKTINVKLLPSPVADFNVPPKCDGDVIDFVSTNNINADQVTWDFGDETIVTGTVGALASTTHQYAKSSFNFVKLTLAATPQSGITCIDEATQYVTVGALPISDFTFSKVCQDENTEFSSTTTNNVNLATVGWDFGDGDIVPEGNAGSAIVPPFTNSGRTSGTYGNPIHKFATNGNFTVSMIGRTISTQGGCPDDQVRTLSILTNITPSPDSPYLMKTLNGEDGFWVPEDKNGNSTWAFAAPSGSTINSTDLAWATNPAGPYLENDQSYVNSPCFDMSAFQRPVISINQWANTHNDDGAVLQYSTNGGLTWLPVGGFIGDISTGLNWFNAQGVASNPGGQSNVAWARTNQIQWLEGKHSLDFIPVSARSQVRFRVAFASRTRNNITLDGFAFNDVRLEERNRTILVENFTNSTVSNAEANNQNFLDFQNGSSASELVKLQYHIGLPTSDDINKQNPADPNARAAFYGLTNNASLVPKGYLDGASQGNFLSNWVNSYFSLRSLVSSPLKIDLTSLPTDPDKFAVEATVEATNNITKGRISLFIAVIEKTVGTEGFVVRKILPNASGTEIKLPLLIGDKITVSPQPWEVINPVDPQQLAVVAFVQDIETRDVLQATLLQNPGNLPTIITGLEKPFAAIADAISFYPNPVDQEFTVQLPTVLKENTPIKLTDQLGKIIHDTAIPAGQNSKTLSTRDLAGGVYLLQIESGKGNIVRKKVMVVHNK